MPGTDEPSPIPLRPTPGGLDAASQESVAVALTLMTKFAFDATPAERADTAAAVAVALRELAERAELAPELRRLCARLQRIWAALEER